MSPSSLGEVARLGEHVEDLLERRRPARPVARDQHVASAARSPSARAIATAFARTAPPRSCSPRIWSARARPPSTRTRSCDGSSPSAAAASSSSSTAPRSVITGPPAGVLVADRGARQQLGVAELAGDLRRLRVNAASASTARPARWPARPELEQAARARSGGVLDPAARARRRSRSAASSKASAAAAARAARTLYSTPRSIAAERRGRREVVREVGERAPGPPPERSSASPTRRCSSARRRPAEPVVERAAHQLVREAVGEPARAGAPRSCRCGPPRRAPRAARLRRCRRARRRTSSSNSGAGGGGQLEQVAGAPARRRASRWLTTSRTLSGVPSSASGRVRRSRRRPPRPRRLHERAPQLADQEGVALGELADRPCELRHARRRRRRPRRGGRTRATSSPERPAEPQPDDVVGAAQVGQRLRQRVRHVGLGVAERGEQQQARAPAGPREVAQQQRASGRRPSAPSSSTSSTGRRRLIAASRSVTAVCRRWRSVSGSASDRGGLAARAGGRAAGAPARRRRAERGAQLGRIGARARAGRAPRRTARTGGAPRASHAP